MSNTTTAVISTSTTILMVTVYLFILLLIGYFAFKKTKAGVAEYFIAGRALGSLVLLATVTLTFLSAFWFYGMAGFYC